MKDHHESPGEPGRRIRGSFPGGPSRPGAEGAPAPTARIRSAEELEAEGRRHQLDDRRRRRRRRTAGVFAAALAAAAAGGLWLGLRSHRTSEELAATLEESQVRDAFISKEVNRTLLELWKMEDVEAGRGRFPGR